MTTIAPNQLNQIALNSTLWSNTAVNPTNASTTMVGGQVQFENDNYRITADDNNTVTVFNKNTGESYQAWGDPHMNIDGQHTFDFWGTTTLQLEDGTKVTIETTPWVHNPEMTLSSKVTITSGDYGVQISGVDSNRTGDLQFDEAAHHGHLLDAVVSDGNVLHENPAGKGFVAMDSQGRLRAVDQQYINETDLKKGGALQAQWADAFGKFAALLAVSFVGGFIAGLKGEGDGQSGPIIAPGRPRALDADNFVMTMTRAQPEMSWLVAAAGALGGQGGQQH